MRQITKEDKKAVYDIYMDETVNPFMNDEIIPFEEFDGIYKRLLANTHFFIFEKNGEAYGICGVSAGYGRTKHCAMIIHLGVKSSQQSKGCGTQIMNEVMTFLKDKGFKRIELAYEDDNPIAPGFYKKLGFEVEGRLKQVIKRTSQDHYVDGIIMSKILD